VNTTCWAQAQINAPQDIAPLPTLNTSTTKAPFMEGMSIKSIMPMSAGNVFDWKYATYTSTNVYNILTAATATATIFSPWWLNSYNVTSTTTELVSIEVRDRSQSMTAGILSVYTTRSTITSQCASEQYVYAVSFADDANSTIGWYLHLTDPDQGQMLGTLEYPARPGWYLSVCDHCDWGQGTDGTGKLHPLPAVMLATDADPPTQWLLYTE